MSSLRNINVKLKEPFLPMLRINFQEKLRDETVRQIHYGCGY